ncbi:hypothetical protein EJ110_NYTH40751 [Nymphaea thermarum]|nr:hypothetical protein EJ110_NYTH40751 [Nymphaea thermarum]
MLPRSANKAFGTLKRSAGRSTKAAAQKQPEAAPPEVFSPMLPRSAKKASGTPTPNRSAGKSTKAAAQKQPQAAPPEVVQVQEEVVEVPLQNLLLRSAKKASSTPKPNRSAGKSTKAAAQKQPQAATPEVVQVQEEVVEVPVQNLTSWDGASGSKGEHAAAEIALVELMKYDNMQQCIPNPVQQADSESGRPTTQLN